MRILITGGTGLIGRTLAANMLAGGHEVIVLSRNPDKARLAAGVQVEAWDARTGRDWASLITSDTAIVNLAGESIGEGRWTDQRKDAILSSRINAGKAITEAIQTAAVKPRVLIQSSAVGYYGPRGDEELTEHSTPGHDFQAEVCKAWEASTASIERVRRAVIRSGVVLSLDGGALPRIVQPVRLFVGGSLGSGRQWFSWIHIKDEVKAIRFLIENETLDGVFNLSAPNPLTNSQFTRTLGRLLKRPTIMPVPRLALRLLFGEMATILLDGQRVIPNHLLNQGFEFDFPDAEGALHDLLYKH
jgi:uncharacterized protein (TIGR01777 family)